ncbi:BTAD domain-containing putative transcriptional regulator [Actinoplanes subtropicus]|uniref:BTAD domain-containing putative transcriptional regulator n=1 Tax=Actinoplanes subtropicus TaxID=543632 RepID=UPI0004C3F847|nr:BTAD domain-containing putative transcriptional regulator [Actinoplanes subtropicus]
MRASAASSKAVTGRGSRTTSAAGAPGRSSTAKPLAARRSASGPASLASWPVVSRFHRVVGQALLQSGRSAERAGRLAAAVTELRAALDLWLGPVLCGITSPELQPEIAGWEERRLGLAEEVYDLASRPPATDRWPATDVGQA